MKEQLKDLTNKWLKEADRLSNEAMELNKQEKYEQGLDSLIKSMAIRECAIDILKLFNGL